MIKLYLLPGLAADYRNFGSFQVPGMQAVHLQWPTPHPSDTMADYALKLRDQIQEDEPFCLLGVSFGGMVVNELTQRLSPIHTFLVSAPKTHHEIPRFFRRWSFIPKALPFPVMQALIINARRKGANISPEYLKSLISMIRDADKTLFDWSTNAALRWRNTVIPENLSHIHGSEDSVYPAKNMNPDLWVPGANHYLMNTHQQEVAQWVRDTLVQKGCSLPD